MHISMIPLISAMQDETARSTNWWIPPGWNSLVWGPAHVTKIVHCMSIVNNSHACFYFLSYSFIFVLQFSFLLRTLCDNRTAGACATLNLLIHSLFYFLFRFYFSFFTFRVVWPLLLNGCRAQCHQVSQLPSVGRSNAYTRLYPHIRLHLYLRTHPHILLDLSTRLHPHIRSTCTGTITFAWTYTPFRTLNFR